MDSIVSKVCRSCQTDKPISEFSKNSKNKDGYRYFCKVCEKEKAKSYYEQNKERVKATVRAWQKDHPGDVKLYKRAFYHKNKVAKTPSVV